MLTKSGRDTFGPYLKQKWTFYYYILYFGRTSCILKDCKQVTTTLSYWPRQFVHDVILFPTHIRITVCRLSPALPATPKTLYAASFALPIPSATSFAGSWWFLPLQHRASEYPDRRIERIRSFAPKTFARVPHVPFPASQPAWRAERLSGHSFRLHVQPWPRVL